MSIDKKSLIAQIGKNIDKPAPVASKRQTPIVPEGAAVLTDAGEESRKTLVATSTKSKASPGVSGTGKQSAFWLDDEDRALFHEFSMILYSQGIKPSHNLILRAALRLTPRDHRLTEKVRDLVAQDGRKTRHQRGGD